MEYNTKSSSHSKGEIEVTSKYTSLNDLIKKIPSLNNLSTEKISADRGEDEVITSCEASPKNDLAKQRIYVVEDVAPEAGVELSCGKGDGTANWINTFDLNELPPEEDN